MFGWLATNWFVFTRTNPTKCLVKWNLLRIRVCLRNIRHHLKEDLHMPTGTYICQKSLTYVKRDLRMSKETYKCGKLCSLRPTCVRFGQRMCLCVRVCVCLSLSLWLARVHALYVWCYLSPSLSLFYVLPPAAWSRALSPPGLTHVVLPVVDAMHIHIRVTHMY